MKNVESLKDLTKAEKEQLVKFHQIVADSIKEEKLIVENLKNPPKEVLTKGQQVSDKVAQFGGSWMFIIIFGVVLAVWIVFNVLAATEMRFDPYPFILMNLVLSTIAAIQAPVIMMSQNRKEEIDRKRAENDYLINMKAEIEIRNLHQKINLLMEEQIKKLIDSQTLQLKLLNEIQTKVDKTANK
jgi:uncharacterized membrane protein